MKHTIVRSFLERSIETWAVEMPDDMDPTHLTVNHPLEFDTDLISGGDPLSGWTSELVEVQTEAIDYNELKLEVVERGPANVLPFQRKEQGNA